MLSASHRSSLVLAIATAAALGGLGPGSVARAQAELPTPAPSGGSQQASSGSLPDPGRPAGVDVFPYRLRGRALLVPTNGALSIETFTDVHPVVEVTDATGAFLPGLIHEVGASDHGPSDHGVILAWVPSAPLAIGSLIVALRSPYDASLVQVESVRVVAPFPSTLPPIRVEPSASLVVLPELRECCLGAPGGPPNGCFVTRRESYVRVDHGFTSPAPSAFLNQYLFRIKPAPGSTDGRAAEVFMPFEQVGAAGFYQPAAEYCLQVEALNIATRKIDSYALTACTDGVDALVGVLELDVPLDQLMYPACPLPPDSQSAPWCNINRDLCFGEDPQACAIRNHVCDGGPQPQIVSALRSGSAGSDSLVMPGTPRDDSDGCTAASSRARPSLAGTLWLLALALARRSRRRSAGTSRRR